MIARLHPFPSHYDDYQPGQDIVVIFQRTTRRIPSIPTPEARKEIFEKGTRRPLAWPCFVSLVQAKKKRKKKNKKRRREDRPALVHFSALASTSSVSGWHDTSACASVVSLFPRCCSFEFVFHGTFLSLLRSFERLYPMNCLPG